MVSRDTFQKRVPTDAQLVRVAILSDVHANLPALHAVLTDAARYTPDEFWCLGDVVGYGPDANECIDILAARCQIILAGNHDRALVDDRELERLASDARGVIEWTRKHISPTQRRKLETWNFTPLVPPQAPNVTLVHASLRDYLGEYVSSTPVAQLNLNLLQTPLGFVGHTHVPRIFEQNQVETIRPPFKLKSSAKAVADPFAPIPQPRLDWTRWSNAKWLVNPGSVGRSGDQSVLASYLIVDFTKQQMLLRRVRYPLAPLVRKMQRLNVNDMPFNQSVIMRLVHAIGDAF